MAFQLDGVLIGAGDARFLALAGLAATAAYAPFVGSVWVLHAGLPWLWVAYGAWLIARSVLLGLRTAANAGCTPRSEDRAMGRSLGVSRPRSAETD